MKKGHPEGFSLRCEVVDGEGDTDGFSIGKSEGSSLGYDVVDIKGDTEGFSLGCHLIDGKFNDK